MGKNTNWSLEDLAALDKRRGENNLKQVFGDKPSTNPQKCATSELMKPKGAYFKNNETNEVKVFTKPLSVNRAWQGRRFKTEAYKQYEKELLLLLPHIILPATPLKIYYEFGFSNKASDLDNPIKSLQDILCKKYHFDDWEITELRAKKVIVKKGEEYIYFKIESL